MSDAAKLREAIAQIDATPKNYMCLGEHPWTSVPNWALTEVVKAARDTPPRTKPMWFVIWQSPAGFHTTGHLSPTGAAEAEANLLINDRLAIATVGPYEVPDDLP